MNKYDSKRKKIMKTSKKQYSYSLASSKWIYTKYGRLEDMKKKEIDVKHIRMM
jgi:hypothetical protein